MAPRSISLTELQGALARAGVREGDVLMMHASMLGVGPLEGHDAAAAPAAIVRCLIEYLGSRGTLAVPAFNFDFCKGIAFDRERTPCLSMGVLAEAVRAWPGSRRSRHPTQSIAAVGPMAARLCDDPGEKAFDARSAFGRLHECNARILLFGTNFQAASLIHAAEERIGVPYRYWKEFVGEYIEGGTSRPHRCQMYVRDLTLDPQLNMKPVEQELIERQALSQTPLGRGALLACEAQALLSAAEAVIKRNPWCLVGSVKGANDAASAQRS